MTMPRSALKVTAMMPSARPEFCMPPSIMIARRSRSATRNASAHRQPSSRPPALCRITIPSCGRICASSSARWLTSPAAMKASSASRLKVPSGFLIFAVSAGQRWPRVRPSAIGSAEQRQQAPPDAGGVDRERAHPAGGRRIGGHHPGEVERREHQRHDRGDGRDADRERGVAAAEMGDDVAERPARAGGDEEHRRLDVRRQVERQGREPGRARQQHELRDQAADHRPRRLGDAGEVGDPELERDREHHGREHEAQDQLLRRHRRRRSAGRHAADRGHSARRLGPRLLDLRARRDHDLLPLARSRRRSPCRSPPACRRSACRRARPGARASSGRPARG